MQKQERIKKLAKDTFRRAVGESIACVFVLIAYAYFLQHAPIGSAKYYGCLIVLVSAGFIIGVVWAFTISRQIAQTHTAEDSFYWREAFKTQAKLLRFVPLWYIAPMTTGIILFIAPTSTDEFASFLLNLIIIGIVCAGITYFNKTGADQLEMQAQEI